MKGIQSKMKSKINESSETVSQYYIDQLSSVEKEERMNLIYGKWDFSGTDINADCVYNHRNDDE